MVRLLFCWGVSCVLILHAWIWFVLFLFKLNYILKWNKYSTKSASTLYSKEQSHAVSLQRMLLSAAFARFAFIVVMFNSFVVLFVFYLFFRCRIRSTICKNENVRCWFLLATIQSIQINNQWNYGLFIYALAGSTYGITHGTFP